MLPVYIPRADFADYLDAYIQGLGLNVKHQMLVKSAKKENENDMTSDWIVEIENLASEAKGTIYTIRCKKLVLSNGIYNDPFVPQVPNTYKGLQVHACRYTNAEELGLKGKEVLVVGFGNSACEIAVDLVEHGAKPTVHARTEQTILPRSTVRVGQSMIYTHAKPLLSVPFGWVPLIGAALLVDPITYLVQYKRWGGRKALKQHNIPLRAIGPIALALLYNEPPVMDIGFVDLVRQQRIKMVTLTDIKSINDHEVEFENGHKQFFDAIVWATGYKMFEGHQHIFSGNILEKIGSGVAAIKTHMLLPGAEHPNVPSFYINYGRLQMLRDGAQSLSWKIAGQLGASSPNDDVDRPESWTSFFAKHAAAVLVYKGVMSKL